MADKTLDGITRRDFLKYSGIFGAGLAVGLNPFKAYGKDINGVYVDDTTIWTPEKFRKEIIDSDKANLVYWRFEGKGNNVMGDREMNDLCRDLKGYIDNFYQINLNKYTKQEGMPLINTVTNLNPHEKFYAPSWSIIKRGIELRIRGPPIPENYEKVYSQTVPYTLKWLENPK